MHAPRSSPEASMRACSLSLGLFLKESLQGMPTFHTAQVNSVPGGVAQSLGAGGAGISGVEALIEGNDAKGWLRVKQLQDFQMCDFPHTIMKVCMTPDNNG